MRYQPRLHIVLHEPEIPPNAGNVGRTSVAIAAKMWLVRPLGFQIDDYYLRRAGLDYWDELEWEVVDSWAHLEERLAASGAGRMWFFSAKATKSYLDATFAEGDVIVFGKESQGLPAEITSLHPDRLLTIPSRPQVRSLNVANCAAIVAYEAIRQWGGTV
ncbi:MAG: tRNA (cytidine(34)-2'-O)-methyltransferase [Planctomycetia bacterium]|nr:tRNA (cytidine(34)-2'-O)-methyltransferase [Planctomycetia bacterium]